jgi:hypothetical protein
MKYLPYKSRILDCRSPIEWSNPLNRGLVNDWTPTPLTGWTKSSTLLDIVRGGKYPRDGTLTTFAASDGWKRGPIYSCVLFNGGATQEYVSCNQITLNNLASGSIVAYANFTSVGNGGMICTRQHDGTGTYAAFGIGTYIDSGGNAQNGVAGTLYWHGNNGVTQAASTSTISTGKWYQIAVTFNSSAANFYINDAAAGTTSGNYSIPNDASATNMIIGGFISSGSFGFNQGLNAYLASLLVYNRVLSASEISAVLNETRAGNPNRWRWVNFTGRSVLNAAPVPNNANVWLFTA